MEGRRDSRSRQSHQRVRGLKNHMPTDRAHFVHRRVDVSGSGGRRKSVHASPGAFATASLACFLPRRPPASARARTECHYLFLAGLLHAPMKSELRVDFSADSMALHYRSSCASTMISHGTPSMRTHTIGALPKPSRSAPRRSLLRGIPQSGIHRRLHPSHTHRDHTTRITPER